MNKRKISVFTGNRAEYSLLIPLLKELDSRKDIELSLIIAGTHLINEFGATKEEILKENFDILGEVDILLEDSTLNATSKAIGKGIISISNLLEQKRPDILVVSADRFEGFAAVIAASQMGIPVAHHEGGDVTQGGALDDSVRHAMTKLSHLHFPTNQPAHNRVLAMGEENWRISTIGSSVLENIKFGRVTDSETLQNQYDLDLTKPLIIFTQHAVALEFSKAVQQVEASLEALFKLAAEEVQIIITAPNNDAGGELILKLYEQHQKQGWPKGIQFHNSLGQANYHGIVSLAQDPNHRISCVGNSSSGIKETIAFACPTVNIGNRQDGRLSPDNIIHVSYSTDEIYNASQKCLFDDAFRQKCMTVDNPYDSGSFAKKMTDILSNVDLEKKILYKKMTLLGETKDGWYR